MPNSYYNASGAPSQGSSGSSATIRGEFNAIVAGFDKLPALGSNGGRAVFINPGATGMTTSSALSLSGSTITVTGDLAVTGALSLANLTLTGALVVQGNTTLGNASGDTLTIAPNAVTWSGNPTHSGNHTFSGNAVFNGNVTLGNAGSDTLTIAAAAVTWSGNPTHSGDHTFTGVLVGTRGTFSSNTLPQVTVDRPGSGSNAHIGYTTTSGTVYAGQGTALTWAVGGATNLAANSWFEVTSASTRVLSAAYGVFGVREGGAYGGAGPSTAYDAIVVESDGTTGITLLTPNTANSALRFGDPESALSGGLRYDHATDTMAILVSGATTFALTSTEATFSSGCDPVLNAATGPGSVTSMGFRGVPQNTQAGNYTLVLADAGKHIYHASGAGAGDTYTIPANSSVAYPIGTAVTFMNLDSNNLTIAITSDTLRLAGAGTTGSRTLAQYGVATAVKYASTAWIISGTGLS